jgi:phosphatidylglycerophosphate synthase
MKFYGRRAEINRWLTRVAGPLFAAIPFTPNQWTLLGLLPSFASAFFMTRHQWLWAAAMVLLALGLDTVDGAVARTTGRITTFGAFLDALVDKYGESALIFGLLFAGLPDVLWPAPVWLFLYFVGSMMSTYSKAAAKEKDYVSEEVGGGLAGHGEKMLGLTCGLVAAVFSPVYLVYTIIALAIAANLTVFQRVALVIRVAERKKIAPDRI